MLSYTIILGCRLISGLLIFIWPLPAIITSTLFDLVDAEFAAKARLNRHVYQLIDKTVDLYWLTLTLIYSYANLITYFNLLFILYLYRFTGQILFYFTKKRFFLFVFANYYENVFIVLFFFSHSSSVYLLLVLVMILKIIQEWFIHIAKLSIREDFLKLGKRRWKKSD